MGCKICGPWGENTPLFQRRTPCVQRNTRSYIQFVSVTPVVFLGTMSMYVRFKRKNMTVFLHVEPSSTFQQVKVRLGENFDMSPDNIILYANDKVGTILYILNHFISYRTYTWDVRTQCSGVYEKLMTYRLSLSSYLVIV